MLSIVFKLDYILQKYVTYIIIIVTILERERKHF